MEKVSSWSKALPVPTATQASGSSAMCTGKPVSLENLLSIFLSRAPPPVNVYPISTKSADSSGGVCVKSANEGKGSVKVTMLLSNTQMEIKGNIPYILYSKRGLVGVLIDRKGNITWRTSPNEIIETTKILQSSLLIWIISK